MFKIDKDKTIHLTRGDKATFKLTNLNSNFLKDDKIKFTIVEKNHNENVIFQKEYIIPVESREVYINLSNFETKIGDIINKPANYWYEIEYNDEQTLVGYDDSGAKMFILYPETSDRKGGK